MNTEYLYDTYSKLGNGKFLYLKDIQTKENTIIDCSQKKDIDRNAFYSLIDGKLHKTEMIDGYLMSIIHYLPCINKLDVCMLHAKLCPTLRLCGL